MAALKRRYLQKTLKVLFALSGNQCAHPGCTNPIIQGATSKSEAIVLSQICHIYSIADNGPRGKANLTEKELNAPDNLILFCPTHHVIIDGQHETYPADLLKEWKHDHEQEMQKKLSADINSVNIDVFSHPYFPRALVDQRIEQELLSLRKARFFAEFERLECATNLGNRLLAGQLSGGTEHVRCVALAWCARLMSTGPDLAHAERFLAEAKKLGSCQEIKIADAFIASQKVGKAAALKLLAKIETPSARSAALMIVAHHDGAEGTVTWMDDTGIGAANLDSEGKQALLIRQLQLSRWDDATETANCLSEQDLLDTPILHHLTGITRLIVAVPTDYRTVVLNQLPFEAKSFPLASGTSAIAARRAARQHFSAGAKAARDLGCGAAAQLGEDYALWLELRDSKSAEAAKQQLAERLRDPQAALRLVPLGLDFGVDLDLSAVEDAIGREIALHGEVTPSAALARFALAFTMRTPGDVANYIARYHNELTKHLDRKAIEFLQIEMLSRAGKVEQARERLKAFAELGLTDAEKGRLDRIIAEASGTDPIEARRLQFEQSGSLNDLLALVDELESKENWNALADYAAVLFERTNSLSHAELFATALTNANNNDDLLELIRKHSEFLAQSELLRLLYAWALYYEGALVEARNELNKLSNGGDNPHARLLRVNLGIALGDWNALAGFVAAEYVQREKRNARDLIGVAQLALHLSLANAKDLLFTAVEKGNDDAEILAAGYFMASNAGWEDDPKVVAWLHKAAELSGQKGPIQRVSLEDIHARKPEWDRRESETWNLLNSGEIPIFLAARSLNKSLIDLMLFPALANPKEQDPRKRSIVPAYSGARFPQPVTAEKAVVGMDATALLTLSMLNYLDKALDAFKGVWIPHTTLAWLFEEKQKAAFHQPSRIERAHKIRNLIATDALHRLVPSASASSDLAHQVGDELALLIAEAERVNEDDQRQRLVLRPAPVHRIASLMQEEADLSDHADVLVSCTTVIRKLRERGQLTNEEEEKALAYLGLREKSWEKEPEIADDAVLYLDDLAVSYLMDLGLLDRLKSAGFYVIVSPDTITESDVLLVYESIADDIEAVLERTRTAINARLEAGEITVGRYHRKADEEQSVLRHPTASVMALADTCDGIVSDDRFVNQHSTVSRDGGTKAPVLSTLDVLDALEVGRLISRDEVSAARTQLRRAGYIFIPLREDELQRYLSSCAVKDGAIIESVELRAIRENLLRLRMSDVLQLPREAPWMDETFRVLVRVLRNLWREESDLSAVSARADWVLDQLDVRGWAHRLSPEHQQNVLGTGRAMQLAVLVQPPSDVSPDVRDGYNSWIERRLLRPIQEQNPELFATMVEWQKGQIEELVNAELPDDEKENR